MNKFEQRVLERDSRTVLQPCTLGNCIVQSKIPRFESAMKALLLMLGIFHNLQIGNDKCFTIFKMCV